MENGGKKMEIELENVLPLGRYFSKNIISLPLYSNSLDIIFDKKILYLVHTLYFIQPVFNFIYSFQKILM